MRLTDLKPEWRRVYRDREQTSDRGGFPTDEYDLQFVCPSCGHPYMISIRVGPAISASPVRVWKYNCAPIDLSWPDKLSLEPSIDNTTGGHGQKHPHCSFHGCIVGGALISV